MRFPSGQHEAGEACEGSSDRSRRRAESFPSKLLGAGRRESSRGVRAGERGAWDGWRRRGWRLGARNARRGTGWRPTLSGTGADGELITGSRLAGFRHRSDW